MAGAPSNLDPSNARRTAWGSRKVWILGLMAAVGLAGAIAYWVAQPQPLGLNVQATDSRAQVRIAWYKASRRVRNAKAGYLEITDGDQNVRVDLDASELHLGYVNYPRQSTNVTVRLVVEAIDGTPAEDLLGLWHLLINRRPWRLHNRVNLPPAAQRARSPTRRRT